MSCKILKKKKLAEINEANKKYNTTISNNNITVKLQGKKKYSAWHNTKISAEEFLQIINNIKKFIGCTNTECVLLHQYKQNGDIRLYEFHHLYREPQIAKIDNNFIKNTAGDIDAQYIIMKDSEKYKLKNTSIQHILVQEHQLKRWKN